MKVQKIVTLNQDEVTKIVEMYAKKRLTNFGEVEEVAHTEDGWYDVSFKQQEVEETNDE
jgi:hypothetical protein